MNNVKVILNSVNGNANPNSTLNLEYYNEDGKKDLMNLAKTIDKMGQLLTIDELKSIKDVIDFYKDGDLLVFKMLERKVEMIEHPERDFSKTASLRSMGADLKPLQEA